MTSGNFQRADHSTVSAYIMVAGAAKLIDFLSAVFGATTVLRHDRPDGSIMHASVRIGDSVVMIADAMPDYPAFPVWLHVYVPDVDETYATALGHGATVVQSPTEKGDGDRRGGFADPAGNTWWIATAM